MSVLNECLEHPDGAHFHRGDLHVHSYGGSHDVSDTGMTPDAIIDTAIKEGLKIIAIADHNGISNVQAAIDAAKGRDITVVPAVELSTPEGHLLCYFPDFESLASFHGRLDLADRGTANSRCRTAMFTCLEYAQALGGFGILAHVDAGNGLETNSPGGSPHKADIICHPALLGIELSGVGSTVRYSPEDTDPVRVQIGRRRIDELKLGERQYLARILNSDAHTINALGRNAAHDKKMTRYKMVAPSFEGLRLALLEGDSRIRLESEVPEATPFVVGIKISGGFLDGQCIHFSKNLNCIIGGRGTGKSTTFEAVRCLTGSASNEEVVDSEVWPHKLHLFWCDEAGQIHTLSRAIGQELENDDDPFNGPISFSIDCFGQGEAAKVREKSKDDPLALLYYLDAFAEASDALREESDTIERLIAKQEEVAEAERNVSQIPQLSRALAVVQQQLKAFQSARGDEIIALKRKLASDKAVRAQLIEAVSEIEGGILDQGVVAATEAARSSIALGPDEEVAPEIPGVLSAIDHFSAKFSALNEEIKEEFKVLQEAVKAASTSWSARERPIREEIEARRVELEAKGVKLDMAHISKLATQEAGHLENIRILRGWEPHLKELKVEYAALLKSRWASRRKVFQARQAYAVKASRALSEVLTDLQVKLQYIESAYSEDAVSIIAEAMGWRTVSHRKARNLVEQMSLPGLLAAIVKNDIDAVLRVEVDEGVAQFARAEAAELLDCLGAPSVRTALERCHVDDLPRLVVSKRIELESGFRFVQRDFAQLSLGQQQSVLLALILSSDSKKPLIIDQPEDNLDSEFIFHTFVPVLRRAKERRQVIIVTHNANIAVLGDAEQLIILKSNSESSRIFARGAIDDSSARDAACKVLEGAREAFTKRARIYGIA